MTAYSTARRLVAINKIINKKLANAPATVRRDAFETARRCFVQKHFSAWTSIQTALNNTGAYHAG